MLSAVCIPATRIQCFTLNTEIKFPVVIERGSHPFPFRTRQLSLSSPMILRGQLCGKVGRRRDKIYEGPRAIEGLFLLHWGPNGLASPPPGPDNPARFGRTSCHSESTESPTLPH